MTYFLSLHLREVNSLPSGELSLLFSGLQKNATKNKIKRHVFFPDMPAQVFQHLLTRDTMDIMSACKTRLMGQKVPRQDI